jgi:hypothetical protein
MEDMSLSLEEIALHFEIGSMLALVAAEEDIQMRPELQHRRLLDSEEQIVLVEVVAFADFPPFMHRQELNQTVGCDTSGLG